MNAVLRIVASQLLTLLCARRGSYNGNGNGRANTGSNNGNSNGGYNIGSGNGNGNGIGNVGSGNGNGNGNANGKGDPILTGFDGRSFEFRGTAGHYFTFLSERVHRVWPLVLLSGPSTQPSLCMGRCPVNATARVLVLIHLSANYFGF